MMELDAAYPTTEHSNAADEIVDFFRAREGVEAVLLVNSCARGKASRDSCLDIAVLLDPDVFNDSGASLETKWQEHLRSASVFQRLKSVGRYSVVHLYFQVFGRLQFAFKSFLQGLFIAHRKYPIAYDKWIKEQVVEVLKLPELYGSLPSLFELDHFESPEIILKALDLKRLVGEYLEN